MDSILAAEAHDVQVEIRVLCRLGCQVKLECEDERNTTLTSEPFMVLRRPELPVELYKERSMKKSRFFLGFNSGKVIVNVM